MHRISALGLVIAVAAVLSTGLLMATMVLALSGATGACTWTGTIGVALLAVWLVAINVRKRPARRPVRGEDVDHEAVGPVNAGTPPAT